MLRTTMFSSVLLLGGMLFAVLFGTASHAHAGGWSWKKVCRSVKHRVEEAKRLDNPADKIADEMARKVASSGRRLTKSRAVKRATSAVKDAGACIGTQARKGAHAVEKAVCSIPKRLSWGYRGTKKRVVAQVQAPVQRMLPVVGLAPASCEPADPC